MATMERLIEVFSRLRGLQGAIGAGASRAAAINLRILAILQFRREKRLDRKRQKNTTFRTKSEYRRRNASLQKPSAGRRTADLPLPIGSSDSRPSLDIENFRSDLEHMLTLLAGRSSKSAGPGTWDTPGSHTDPGNAAGIVESDVAEAVLRLRRCSMQMPGDESR